YTRRGGIRYLISGLRGRYRIYREGLGSLKDFVKVAMIHIVISLIPNKLRGIVYAKKLHA
ncbi:ammonia monooxygenase, partial [Lactiplantibacillus plantarum]|nr:ammonia monooxygenase [Lactiplantibacillus plantarum]MBU7459579.1 ammonia monooxygenase [Lactiplantibacillus plantarum]